MVCDAIDDYLDKKSVIEEFRQTIPELIKDAIESNESATAMRAFLAEVQEILRPVMQESKIRQIDIELQRALTISKIKVWLIHRVATNRKIPKDLTVRGIVQLLIEDGYLQLQGLDDIALVDEDIDQPQDLMI